MSIILDVLATLGGPVQVAFLAGGTGASSGAGTNSIDVPYPTLSAGNKLILHVVARDASGAAITTPSGWTLVNNQVVGSTTVSSSIFQKTATGSESGNLTVTVVNSVNAHGRMYALSNGSTTESAGGQVNTASSTTMPATNITSTVALSAGFEAFWAQINTTIGNISGESGGDFTEAVAEYATVGNIMSLQIATMAATASITGGSATLGSAGTNRITHAFVVNP